MLMRNTRIQNLCSGSVRQLNNEITAKRHVHFMAFALVSAPEQDFENSRIRQMEWLKEQGFEVVEYKVVTKDNLDEAMQYFSTKIETNDFPSDGLVALYDDIAYGESLGTTAKFPRNAFAFKWADEQKETTLLEIEWSPSRTGLINPVAIFDPVELEGTTVSRASVHNISIMEGLELGHSSIRDTTGRPLAMTGWDEEMCIAEVDPIASMDSTYASQGLTGNDYIRDLRPDLYLPIYENYAK